MTINQLKNKLLNDYSTDNLNKLTIKIIELNNQKQNDCLIQMSELVNDFTPFVTDHSSKLFSRLIMLYHPDKFSEYQKAINACSTPGDLNRFAHISPMLELVDQLGASAASGFKSPKDFEQEYGWSYANTSDDYFIAQEEAEEPVSMFYDEENIDDYAYHQSTKFIAEDTFLGAVKRKIYGPMQVHFPVHQLEDIEEIEMAEYEIESLEGIEYCRYVRILDLSYNTISDISNLEHCIYIEELYLQDNDIYDIDYLSYLPDLRVVDLANNHISDITGLLHLNGLEFVNLLGNPVPKIQVEQLLQKGIVVVY